jgi:hypothetical protein
MSRNPQVLFAVVTQLDETADIKGGKILNLRSGHMETNSIRKRTVHFVPENVDTKASKY